MRPVPGPTPLEIASGAVTGTVPRPADGTVDAGRGAAVPVTALQALEAAVLPALQRTPCVVSFSGGMDSSFVLGVATRVARRHGLALPVPVSWRFADAPRAQETPWQERVVAALGLEDWQLLHADDDLDLVGPVARRLLARYGVLHPPNLHLHLPVVELAAGGSLLTGVGGDQVLAGWRRQGRRPVARAARDRVPSRVAVAIARRRGRDDYPWLRPGVSRQVAAAHRAELLAEPRHAGRVEWHTRRRSLTLACAALGAVAADHDVTAVNPLLDPGFTDALTRVVRATGPVRRSALLAELSRGALPPVVTAHRPKARFTEVFLREPTRQLVRAWDGSGVDETLVDVEALRDVWSRWPVPGLTGALVQQVWLSRFERAQLHRAATAPSGQVR